MNDSRTLMITVLLVLATLAAACGDSGGADGSTSDDGVGSATTVDLSLVESGVRFIGLGTDVDGAPIDEVDVSLVKSSPDVVGTEAYWRYEQSDPDAFHTLSVAIDTQIDGRPFRVRAWTARGSNERIVEEGPVRIAPTDDGIEVTYRFTPLGASDLVDENRDPTRLSSVDILMNFDAGSASADADFVVDEGADGLLEYVVGLEGGLDLSGSNSEVMFRTVESDSDVETVEDDPAAIEAVQQGDDAQAADLAECVPDVYELDGTSLTMSPADRCRFVHHVTAVGLLR